MFPFHDVHVLSFPLFYLLSIINQISKILYCIVLYWIVLYKVAKIHGLLQLHLMSKETHPVRYHMYPIILTQHVTCHSKATIKKLYHPDTFPLSRYLLPVGHNRTPLLNNFTNFSGHIRTAAPCHWNAYGHHIIPPLSWRNQPKHCVSLQWDSAIKRKQHYAAFLGSLSADCLKCGNDRWESPKSNYFIGEQGVESFTGGTVLYSKVYFFAFTLPKCRLGGGFEEGTCR